jgi:hypothetical protein
VLILCKIERIIYGGQKMSVVVLDENKWQKILAFLQTEDRVNIGKQAGCKRFIEAIKGISIYLSQPIACVA